MKWNEFLDTATRLAKGATEGDWRSAISRSYYADFHFFREFLQSHGLDVGRGGQAHVNIYGGLNNCGFSNVAVIAQRLDGIRSRRVEADYDLRRRIDSNLAENIVGSIPFAPRDTGFTCSISG